MRILCIGDWVINPESTSGNSSENLGQTIEVVKKLSLLGQDDITLAVSTDFDSKNYLLDFIKDLEINFFPEIIYSSQSKYDKDQKTLNSKDVNNLISPNHVKNIIKDARPDILYICNAGNLKNIDLELPQILKFAHENGAITFVSVGKSLSGYRFLTSAFLQIDYLFCSISEARSITGFTQASRAAKALTAGGAGISIVVKDYEGLEAHDGYTLIEMPSFSQTSSVELKDHSSIISSIFIGMYQSGMVYEQLKHVSVEILKNALLLGLAAEKMEAEFINNKNEYSLNNLQKIVESEGGAVLKATRTTELVP
ncbi:hypothetical protein FJY84_09040 [Candidatus Bathyarchaeota archaeon]|nr:hypothetical protein [Candidatus Bathyarchaeota archaeon]